MTPDELRVLLERVQNGSLPVDAAFSALERLPFSELGYAKVDHHRALRLGFPEVVLGEGKRPEQIAALAEALGTTPDRIGERSDDMGDAIVLDCRLQRSRGGPGGEYVT